MPLIRSALLSVVLVLLAVSSVWAETPDLSAKQWLEASAEQMTATSAAVDLTLTRTRTGGERVVKLETRMSRREAGLLKTWILQLAPEVQAGSQFLTLVRDGEEEEQYQLLPVMGTVSRIKPSENFSLFGTDFQIRDISVADPDVGSHVVLKSDTVMVGGTSYPVTVVQSTYETGKHRKVLRYLDDDKKLPLKVEYFDKSDKMVKRLTVREVAQIGGVPMAMKSRMENLSKDTYTDLVVDKAEFDLSEEALPESTFTKDHLIRVGQGYADDE